MSETSDKELFDEISKAFTAGVEFARNMFEKPSCSEYKQQRREALRPRVPEQGPVPDYTGEGSAWIPPAGGAV